MLGDYVAMNEENEIINFRNPRTRSDICMGPTGNIQGLIKFMCVETGKEIVRSFTRLPMPNSIIKKVEKLAEKERANMELILKTGRKKHLIGKMNKTMLIRREMNKMDVHTWIQWQNFLGQKLQ